MSWKSPQKTMQCQKHNILCFCDLCTHKLPAKVVSTLSFMSKPSIGCAAISKCPIQMASYWRSTKFLQSLKESNGLVTCKVGFYVQIWSGTFPLLWICQFQVLPIPQHMANGCCGASWCYSYFPSLPFKTLQHWSNLELSRILARARACWLYYPSSLLHQAEFR